MSDTDVNEGYGETGAVYDLYANSVDETLSGNRGLSLLTSAVGKGTTMCSGSAGMRSTGTETG